MSASTYRTTPATGDVRKTVRNGYVFGVPLGDLGWFASLLMGLATGMAAFFLATFAGIVGILVWNTAGHRADYAWSYLWVGLPVGATAMLLAVSYMGILWVRGVAKKR
jgi:hypothetical protein